MNSFLYIIVIASGLAVTNAAVDCNTDPCKRIGLKRSLCLYPDPNPAPACGTVLLVGLSQKEKKDLVNLHNDLRQYVAAGQEKRGRDGPQPPALDMEMITWDDELAEGLQRWVNQCIKGLDRCPVAGSNSLNVVSLAVGGTSGNMVYHNYTHTFMTAYNNGVTNIPKSTVTRFNTPDSRYGWYSTMMYSKTKKIGCGRIIYNLQPGTNNLFHMICGYSPGGAVRGEPIYKTKEFSQQNTKGALV